MTEESKIEIIIACQEGDIDIQIANQLIFELTGRDTRLTVKDLCEIIDSENSILFVAKHNGNTVGMATLGTYTTPTGKKAWIEDVVVAKEQRGKGIGRKLIEYIIEYAKNNMSPCALMLTSRPERIEANKLYGSAGFELRRTNAYKMTVRE